MIVSLELTKAFLESKGLGYQMADENEAVMRVGFRGLRNMGVIELLIRFFENDTVCIMYKCPFPIPGEKIEPFYALCSDLNCKYRFAKFCVKEDRTIRVYVDARVASESAGEVVYQLLSMLPSLIDEAFPVLMKELWADRNDFVIPAGNSAEQSEISADHAADGSEDHTNGED